MPRALTCQEIVELVTEHLDGALDEVRQAVVAEHLAGCPDCATYVRQIRQTIGAVRGLRDSAQIPDCDALVRAFRALGPDV